MILKEVVKKRNEVAYQIIKNAYYHSKINHNYLISAFYSLDTDYFSYFLIQVLVCQEEFGCGKCENCIRVLKNEYSDLYIIDGAQTSIKKAEILNINTLLKQTALEEKNVRIFLIKNIENTSIQAHNSLLKMIEEPNERIYIIISTNNINKLPKTIISRSQIIYLFKISRDVLITELIKLKVPEDDSHILSNICGSTNNANNFFLNDYNEYKKKIITFFNTWIKNNIDGKIYLLSIDYKSLDIKIFLKLFIVFLNDIWREKENKGISFKNSIQLLNKLNKKEFPTYRCIEITNELIIKMNNKLNMKSQIYSWVIKMFEEN